MGEGLLEGRDGDQVTQSLQVDPDVLLRVRLCRERGRQGERQAGRQGERQAGREAGRERGHLYIKWVRVPPEAAHFFLGKVTALGVLC